jgi:hypothetical protein
MRRNISSVIGLVAVTAPVFGVYFLFSTPFVNSRSSPLYARPYEQSAESTPETAPPEPVYDPATLPRIEVGHVVEFGNGLDNRALIAGWAPPESGGVWSFRKNAIIGFVVGCEAAVCDTRNAILLLEGSAVTTPQTPSQTIELWIGKKKVDQGGISIFLSKVPFDLEGVKIRDGAALILSLRFPDAISPEKGTEIAFRIKSLLLKL